VHRFAPVNHWTQISRRKGLISPDGKRGKLAAISGAAFHVVFDMAAWLAAGGDGIWLSRAKHLRFPAQSSAPPHIAGPVTPVTVQIGPKSINQMANKPLFFGVF
jgi:hypothetical protein